MRGPLKRGGLILKMGMVKQEQQEQHITPGQNSEQEKPHQALINSFAAISYYTAHHGALTLTLSLTVPKPIPVYYISGLDQVPTPGVLIF